MRYIAFTAMYFAAGVAIAAIADMPMVLTGAGLVAFLWGALLVAFFTARELLDQDDPRSGEFMAFLWGTPIAMLIGVIAVYITVWLTWPR
jgi:hypothetical protein